MIGTTGTGPRSITAALGSRIEALCLETQSRQIMAILVNEVVADALRLGLHDGPAERIVKANGAHLRRTGSK